MNKFNQSGISPFADLTVVYGEKSDAKDYWKEIINETDIPKRNELILKFIDSFEKDNEKTGFLKRNDDVNIDSLENHKFKIDDNDLYFTFFDNLKKWNNLAKEHKDITDGFIAYSSIKDTLNNYFGIYLHGTRDKRLNLTSVVANENDEFISPSIKIEKGQNCAECVEYASISHNLWLLMGVKSFYITSKNCKLDEPTNEFSNDGHAFTIVEYGNNKYRMCDFALENFGVMEGNPIDSMLNGEPVKFKNMIYANANVKNQEK
jgi:hypothetical protein